MTQSRDSGALLEASLSLVFRLDRAGRTTYLNRRWSDWTGLPTAAGLELGWTAALDAADRERVDESLRLVASKARPYRDEVRLKSVSGESVWLDCRAEPEYDANGGVVGVVGSAADISERRVAAARLRARERQQAAIAQLAERALARLDLVSAWEEAMRSVAFCLDVEMVSLLEFRPEDRTCRRISGLGWESAGEPVDVSGDEGSLAAVALGSADPVVFDDLQNDERFADEVLVERGVASGIIVRIPSRERPSGLLGAFSRSRRSFTWDDVHFMRSAAGLIGAMLERSRIEAERVRLVALVERTGDAVAICDLEGRVLYANQAGRRQLELPEAGALPSLRFWDLVASDSAERVWSEMLSTLLDGESWGGELRLHALGSRRLFDVEMDSSAIPDPGTGRAAWLGAVWRDVTQRKADEAALRQSQGMLAEAQRIAGLGSWESDLTTGELRWSDEVYRLVGAEPGSLQPTTELFYELVPEDERERVRHTFEKALRERRPYEIEHRLRRIDRSERLIHQQAEVQRDDEGEPVRVLGFARDVTDERLLQERLRQSQKLDAIGTLAGGLAHDFNNLLTAVLNFAELLKLELEGSQLERYVDQITTAGRRGTDLVAQMLAFSRLSEGGRRPIDLRPAVKEVLGLLKAALGSRIEIGCQVPPRELWVEASPTDVHQVVMNLCNNGAQAMPGGGRLTIRLERAPRPEPPQGAAAAWARLRVEDEGEGMGPGVLSRACDPFFTTKEVGQGTGLGLSVVHGLVTSMGGRLRLDSTPGRGTVATVDLPLATPPGHLADVEEGDALPRGTARILFVDDESQVRSSTAELLQRLGYSVAVAADGEEALALLEEDRAAFEVVLSDMTMPRMTGLELLERIRARGIRVPVLLCTGHGAGMAESLLAAGADGVMRKPLDLRSLAERIRDVTRPSQG